MTQPKTIEIDDYEEFEIPPPYESKPIRKKIRKLIDATDLGRFLEKLYGSTTTDALANKYKLERLRVELYDALQEAASAYVMHGPYDYTPYQDAEAQQKYLKDIASRAETLANDLWLLPDEFCEGARERMSKHGAEVGRFRGLNGWYTAQHDRDVKFAMARSLRALNATLMEIQSGLNSAVKRPKKGRPKVHTIGLEQFCIILGEFWTGIAQRKFTASYSGKNVKSRVVAFITEALAHLDDVPKPAIVTACRAVRSELKLDKNTRATT